MRIQSITNQSFILTRVYRTADDSVKILPKTSIEYNYKQNSKKFSLKKEKKVEACFGESKSRRPHKDD